MLSVTRVVKNSQTNNWISRKRWIRPGERNVLGAKRPVTRRCIRCGGGSLAN